MISWQELTSYKKCEVAVLLGSGPSINSITQDQWNKIQTYDIWSMNNWIYHPSIVPHFYHLELKSYNFHIFKERLKAKKDAYAGCSFIIPDRPIKIKQGKGKIRVGLEHAILPHDRIYKYSLFVSPRKGSHNIRANRKLRNNCLTKVYDASISVVLELLYKFAYSRVYLFGIDLIDSRYFWTGGDPIYGRVHHQTNKSHEGKPPEQPHATAHMKDYIVDFNQRMMSPLSRNLYVGHTETLLYPDIPYCNILGDSS